MTLENNENNPKPELPSKKPTHALGEALRDWLALLGILLLELLLPVLIAGAGFWYVFGYYGFWQNDRIWMLVLFGVAVFAVALVLSVSLDRVLEPLRRRFFQRGAGLGKDPITRLVKMALGGIIIPIGLVVAANLVQLPPNLKPEVATPMEYIIAASSQAAVSAPPDNIGKLALQAEDSSTRNLAIQALQGLRSAEGLAQLLKIASDDDALQDGGSRAALQTAIASYRLDAKAPLIALFKSLPSDGEVTGADAGDLYDRYFSQSFTALRAEVADATSDEVQRRKHLAEIDVAEIQLQESLAAIAPDPAAPGGKLVFVLQTMQAIDVKEDADLLAFAKATAVDADYSSVVRGEALQLVAKLGDEKDLDWLYAYLKNDDSLLQAHALQAIVALQDKITPKGPSN